MWRGGRNTFAGDTILPSVNINIVIFNNLRVTRERDVRFSIAKRSNVFTRRDGLKMRKFFKNNL